MRIGLATLAFPETVERAIEGIQVTLRDAAAEGVTLVCTPENYLPGLRGFGFPVEEVTSAQIASALERIGEFVREYAVALILGAEYPTAAGSLVSAVVFDRSGMIIGRQDKVQLSPEEDGLFVAGDQRAIFEIEGLRFGISICHEATHYPETVRSAARAGAQVVFHPQMGFPTSWGGRPQRWADPENSLHEKAFMCRAAENSIYFATANYAFNVSKTTSAVINPDGTLLVHQPYGEAGLLIADLILDHADRRFADRLKPDCLSVALAPRSCKPTPQFQA